MQIPVMPDRLAGTTGERGSVGIPPDVSLSIESQLKLRSLYDYIDFCRSTLDEIERDLLHVEFGAPDASRRLKKVAKKLSRFGVEADSWGFSALYEIALGLQMLLLNSGGRVQSDGIWEALQRGLKMLSALLEQCERDFCWRLATADTLDCLNRASHD